MVYLSVLVTLLALFRCIFALPRVQDEAKPTTSARKTSSSTVAAAKRSTATVAPKNIVAFGASYTQTGFISSGTRPNEQNPIGNPAYPGTTFTGGPNFIDFLIARYNNTLAYSYNFARGGAVIDRSLIQGSAAGVPDLSDQVSEFTALVNQSPTYAAWTTQNTMVVIFVGINDVTIGSTKPNWNSNYPEDQIQYFVQLDNLRKLGVKKFVILNVPPMQRCPRYLGASAATRTNITDSINQWNAAFQQKASEYASSNSGIELTIFNDTTPFEAALNNPKAYGAPNNYCFAPDGTSCLWWNDFHAGQAIHDLMAKAIAKQSPFWSESPSLLSNVGTLLGSLTSI